MNICKKLTLSVWACVAIGAFTAPARASDPEAWKQSGTLFERETAQLQLQRDNNLLTLDKQYMEALNRLLAAKRTAGALDAVLRVQDELRRFGESASVPEISPSGTPEDLQALQETYRNNRRRIRGEHARTLLQRTDYYAQNLERLERQLTQQNQIEDALVARQTRLQILDHRDVQTARDDYALYQETLPPAPDPATVAGAPAATAVAPSREPSGNDIFAIKKRWKEFYECMADKNREKAVTYVDPDQVAQLGLIGLNKWLDVLQVFVNGFEAFGGKPDTAEVDLHEDGVHATAVHKVKFDRDDKELDPSSWVKRNGEWYLILTDKPPPRRTLRPPRRRN